MIFLNRNDLESFLNKEIDWALRRKIEHEKTNQRNYIYYDARFAALESVMHWIRKQEKTSKKDATENCIKFLKLRIHDKSTPQEIKEAYKVVLTFFENTV